MGELDIDLDGVLDTYLMGDRELDLEIDLDILLEGDLDFLEDLFDKAEAGRERG